MIEIEKAIEIIENRPVRASHEQYEADVLAVKALTEQKEREKGCEWCNGLSHGGNAYGDTLKELEIRAAITQGYFCSKCGRKLS